MGQGAMTALAQIAADALGIDIDQVDFKWGVPTCQAEASRAARAAPRRAGNAVYAAGGDVIAKLARLATDDQRVAALRRRKHGCGC